MAAPNQRIIYIERETNNARTNFFKIGSTPLDRAAKDLGANAFKLYIYLCDNRDNWRLELSSKDFVAWSNTSESTYDRAFKELKDKDYLIQAPNKKNIYKFVEMSDSYEERHKEDRIILTTREDIEKLFTESEVKESK